MIKFCHFRIPLIFICIFMCGQVLSQIENGCIFIDFETIPNGVPISGTPMSDQFESSFGLTFRLENGSFPVVARVGSPVEAFVSEWGEDEPAPGVDVGQFFITDDGQLSGTVTSPLILDFAIPIDTFAGCILDMDFGEEFTIEALDEFGNVLLSEVFVAGDPGTGDGELTCWGFNLPGCTARITQIKFSGMREEEGGFGLGMDNFRFCYTGANIEIEVEDFSCRFAGRISIFSTTNETYEYSLDGVNFTTDNVFDGLAPDVYEIYIRDSDGCVSTIFEEVKDVIPVFGFADVLHTSCNENNGEIELEIVPNNNANITVNGIDFSRELLFSDLSPGSYSIMMEDSNGCELDTVLIIDPSNGPPVVQEVIVIDDYCNNGNGSIELIVSGGTGTLLVSMNNNQAQELDVFENLFLGTYSFMIEDEQGCIVEVEADLNVGNDIVLTRSNIIAPDCLETNGQFQISASGGNGPLTFLLDSLVVNSNTLFENLASGTYNVLATDDKGCEQSIVVTIPCSPCDIYFPNVIVPDVEGPNNEFRIYTNPGYSANITLYHIYDRWGNLVYEAKDFSIHTQDDIWWDGYYNNSKAVTGVYTYMVIIEDACMESTLYADDVTVLR